MLLCSGQKTEAKYAVQADPESTWEQEKGERVWETKTKTWAG